MSVPNSVHNTPVNSEHRDGYVEDPDPITKIRKVDASDPLHLYPNDSFALTVVLIKLKGTENYQVWSCAMLLALEGKNKTGFIDGSCKRSNTDEVLELNMFGKNFRKLMISFILPREVLPDVRSAYATISSKESHRVASSSFSGSSQRSEASAFVSNVPNKTSSKNRPSMLNKENYVPWSSRLLHYAKSRPNGKLIYNSIINGLYVRQMIPEPCDATHIVPVPETFHEQTDDELTQVEIKQMEADD
ncbi:ribonuclease H-like domain-containing protein [Tanacetum coccineum]